MQRSKAIVLGLSLFLAKVAAADVAAGNAPKLLAPPPLFQQKCSTCHANGEGKPMMAKMLHTPPEKLNLKLSQLSADDIHKLLKTGRNKMPAFAALTPAQIDEVTTYVLKLRS